MKYILSSIVILTLAVSAWAADISKTGLRDTPLDHKTEDYQVDVRVNECMTCHSRRAVAESQAPMVSITHFMDREGQFLASVSPRRYFCNQCHVSQHEVRAPVSNSFVDIDHVLSQPQ